MSTLAIARARKRFPTLIGRAVELGTMDHGDARWFIDRLDGGAYGRWQVVTPSGCEWDDLINDAIDPEAATAGSALEVALEALVAGSEEYAVWYPAGDLTGVDVVDDERVFVSRIVSAVAGGDIAPCLRFLRRGA